MTILRSIATTIAIAGTAIPATYIATSFSNSPPSSSFSKFLNSRFFSPQLALSSVTSSKSGFIKNLTSPPSAVQMENPKSFSYESSTLPELTTEFMVDMKCEGCVSAVKSKVETLEGVKMVEVDLSNQVVRILGSSPVRTMENALEQTGRKAQLIGQGLAEDFLVSAAVAEFKGPEIFGVVRFAQTHMELATIEANFSGLPPGKNAWSINEFGDLTEGPASTGKVYNPLIRGIGSEPLGDLGTLEVDEKGEAYYSGIKNMLRVLDLIGRSVVLYASEDKSDPGLAAAVIARSAGVGENYKKLCTCDGTTIWEAKPDVVTRKV